MTDRAVFFFRAAHRGVVEDDPYHFLPRTGIDLLHNPVQVIADGKFGKIQLRGNLFVCQTLCHKTHQLLLSQG